MAIPFMAYNMAIGKTPTGGDRYKEPEHDNRRRAVRETDVCRKCGGSRHGGPEAAICAHEWVTTWEQLENPHPLDPTPYASGGFWPTSDYYSEMYSEEEDYEPVYDHSMEIETMRANERMGAALAHLYTLYPEAKAQVKEFLDDYPFTF